MNLIDLVQTPLRKVSTNQGGEYHGPCPVCGGTDRFHVWPQQREHGTFWCRSCGIGGDAINFLKIVEGLSFREACQRLNITPDALPKPSPRAIPAAFEPRQAAQAVNTIWQGKAEKLVAYAHQHLLSDKTTISFLADRGINTEAIVRHRLGLLKQDHYRDRTAWGLPVELKENGKQKKLWLPAGIVIPCFDDSGMVTRLRIRRPEGEPRYYVVPGSGTATWYSRCTPPHPTAAVIVESELDAITCAHAVINAVINIHTISLGNASARPDHAAHRLLETVPVILACLDYDDAGKHGSDNLRRWYGDKVKRWPTPDGKDPGDYVRQGGNIAQWLKASLR